MIRETTKLKYTDLLIKNKHLLYWTNINAYAKKLFSI
jgi:hypothetical protein